MCNAFMRGFTLVELLVTISMAAMVLTFGVSGFQGIIRDNRVATQSARLMAALNLARGEAIKRGIQVTVCKANLSANPPQCDAGKCDSGTGNSCWEKGWIVFVDANGNGTLNDAKDTDFCSGGDCTIRVFEALPKGLTLRSGDHVERWIAYQSPGTGLGSGAGSTVNDTFRLCSGKETTYARSIKINSIGRAQAQKGASSCP
jgi:type IV fimbrial biogenesis protein FimT